MKSSVSSVNLEMSTSILSFCLPIRSSWRRWTTWWKWEIEASISSLSLLKLRSKVGGRDIFLCKVEIRKGPNRDIWHQDLAFRINFDGILIRHSLQRWLQAPSQSWCHKLPHALPDIFNISQGRISHGGTCVESGQTSRQTSQSQWRRPLLPVVGQWGGKPLLLLSPGWRWSRSCRDWYWTGSASSWGNFVGEGHAVRSPDHFARSDYHIRCISGPNEQ